MVTEKIRLLGLVFLLHKEHFFSLFLGPPLSFSLLNQAGEYEEFRPEDNMDARHDGKREEK
ncbi:MAG: hypothetical protein WC346_17130, partial [Methanogenium sp.]